MMKRKLLLFIIALATQVFAQSAYTNQTTDYYHWMDRYEVLSGQINEEVFTAHKPYRRDQAIKSALIRSDSILLDTNAFKKQSYKQWSNVDHFNFQYIKVDNWEFANHYGTPSRLNERSPRDLKAGIYIKKNALYAVNKENFKLIANPVISVWAGKESNSDKSFNYLNSRGVELRGIIDNKVGFYTYFTDNQALYPQYVRNSLKPIDSLKPVLMGENYIKTASNGKVDYISARGYITFNPTKNIGLQFGHDKNFIGNGYRSLVLSENAGAYNFLKLQTKIWKLQYTNLFCQLVTYPTINDSYFPKKYMALHHLSVNLGKHLNLGLFETIMYGNRGGGLDINYLNPIIFYRSVEQNLGSSDNAFLGGDWKLNFMKRFSWYGQVMIDEFLIDNVRSQNGSWTNKQALQTGLKYFNAFSIENLDLQAELNVVRPYTYAHIDNFRSYSHYLQPLAHPRGANFKEILAIARYQATNRLNFIGKISVVKQGLDSLDAKRSTGSNILVAYNQRTLHGGQQNTGHTIGQGNATTLAYLDFTATYMLRHNLFIDFGLIHRKQSSAIKAYEYKHTFVTLGVRLNVARKSFDW